MDEPEPRAGRSDSRERDLRIPASLWRAQIAGILNALGMDHDHAAIAAEVLVAADLMGIESHGAAMLPLYAEQVATGGATADAKV